MPELLTHSLAGLGIWDLSWKNVLMELYSHNNSPHCQATNHQKGKSHGNDPDENGKQG